MSCFTIISIIWQRIGRLNLFFFKNLPVIERLYIVSLETVGECYEKWQYMSLKMYARRSNENTSLYKVR